MGRSIDMRPTGCRTRGLPPRQLPSRMTEPDTSAAARAGLDRQFAGGIAWAGLARLSSQSLTWAVTLFVARLLKPEDYGIVASATVYLGLVRVVTEFGLGTAIVAQRDLSQRQVAQLGGFSTLLGAIAWLVTIALAVPIAGLLRVEELRAVLPVLGFSTALSALNALPTAMLQRELDYRALSQLELLRAVVASLSLFLYAWLGLGYWALVLNEVSAVAVYAGALYVRTRYTLAWPKISEVRSSLRMSGELVVARFAWFAYSTADLGIVSRQLGKTALGDYSMAWTLTSVPSDKLGSVIMSVTPGILARVQRDLPEMRRYFLLLLEGLTVVLLPATIGISLTAHEFVPLLLGEKWRGAIPLVQILGLLLAVRSITPICAQVLVARLRSDLVLRYTLAAAVMMPVSFLIGARWGVTGVASAWVTAAPVLSAMQFAVTAREIRLPIRQLLRAVIRPALAVSLMSAAVMVARAELDSTQLPATARLMGLIATGAVTYLSAILLTMRSRMRQLWRTVRHAA